MKIVVDFSRKDRKKIKKILVSSISLMKYFYWSEKYNFFRINNKITNSHRYANLLISDNSSIGSVLEYIPKYINFNFSMYNQNSTIYQRHIKDLNLLTQMYNSDYLSMNIVRPYHLCGEILNFCRDGYFWYLQKWHLGFNVTTNPSKCFYTDLVFTISDRMNTSYEILFNFDIFETDRLRIQTHLNYYYEQDYNTSPVKIVFGRVCNEKFSNENLQNVQQKIQKYLQTNFINILQRYMLWFLIK